ncbi:hypothetical protein HispidOSU_000614, partial [Sigmodon hispidus]
PVRRWRRQRLHLEEAEREKKKPELSVETAGPEGSSRHRLAFQWVASAAPARAPLQEALHLPASPRQGMKDSDLHGVPETLQP